MLIDNDFKVKDSKNKKKKVENQDENPNDPYFLSLINEDFFDIVEADENKSDE